MVYNALMRALLRDLLRQRLRTVLTVCGVGLGIFTVFVFGALGEHFRLTVVEARDYAGGLVRLYTKTNAEGVNPGVSPETLRRIEAMPEVRCLSPSLVLLLDGFDLESDPLLWLRPQALVEGLEADKAEAVRGQGLRLLAGRWLRAGDRRVAMVVDWLAERRGLRLGAPVTIRHQDYEVVGIYHAPDTPAVPAAIVPYAQLNERFLRPEVERARRFFRGLRRHPLLAPYLPPTLDPAALDALAEGFAHQQASLFRIYEIVPRDRSPAGTQALAEALRAQEPELAVIDPRSIREAMERAVALFLVLTLIVTVLSALVGGLLVVNTMAMAVVERRREIGVKAALGATPAQIAREFVAEAALLAMGGALLGMALGALAVAACEPYLLDRLETGASLFRITPRLCAFSLGTALATGVLAGGIPAYRASRTDPAVCLREL
ncbi:MAG: FtsX-like permease family protein [Planctomycetota bacterium]|nr:MAG: FtsX-like permease family protein [Planctomycetota bacterium]